MRMFDELRFRILKVISAAIGLVVSYGCFTVLYGMPGYDYRINGTVRGSDSNAALPGLRVTFQVTGDQSPIEAFYGQGSYDIELFGNPGERCRIVITDDIDSNENGWYETKDTTIVLPPRLEPEEETNVTIDFVITPRPQN